MSVVLVVAIVGSLAYFLYAITVRDASQIPLLASGAAVLGIVFLALAIVGLVGTWRAGVERRSGRAFANAIVGGIAFMIAAGCLVAAWILASLT